MATSVSRHTSSQNNNEVIESFSRFKRQYKNQVSALRIIAATADRIIPESFNTRAYNFLLAEGLIDNGRVLAQNVSIIFLEHFPLASKGGSTASEGGGAATASESSKASAAKKPSKVPQKISAPKEQVWKKFQAALNLYFVENQKNGKAMITAAISYLKNRENPIDVEPFTDLLKSQPDLFLIEADSSKPKMPLIFLLTQACKEDKDDDVKCISYQDYRQILIAKQKALKAQPSEPAKVIKKAPKTEKDLILDFLKDLESFSDRVFSKIAGKSIGRKGCGLGKREHKPLDEFFLANSKYDSIKDRIANYDPNILQVIKSLINEDLTIKLN